MKRIVFLLLISIIARSGLSAEEMSAEQWLQFNQSVREMFEDHAARVAAGETLPIKCAMPILNALALSRPKGVDPKVLYPGREDWLPKTYSSDHFQLHYADTGSNIVFEYSVQTLEPGTPNYIVMAGRILDSVWQHTIGDLNFAPPISDGYYNGGGNGLLDVYFINFGAYGATIVDSVQATLPLTATTYMFLENDYDGFPGYQDNRLNALRVSAAHEFFHSVQFALDITEAEGTVPDLIPAWVEMSAVYMEEEHYDNINDYYNYLMFFYDVPQWSLRKGASNSSGPNAWPFLHMYGSVIFPLFLTEQFGSGIIKAIWDRCGQSPGPNWVEAIDDAVRQSSGDAHNLQDMFQEFALWNFFTRDNHRYRPGDFFPEAINYDSVNLAARVTVYPSTIAFHDDIPPRDSILPDNLGANYIVLENTSMLAQGLLVIFNPDTTLPWGLTLVGYQNNINLPISIESILYDTVTSQIMMLDAADYDKIGIIVTVLGGDATRAEYSLTVSPIGEGVLQPNGGNVLYADFPYIIRWYYDSTVTEVQIDLSLDNGGTWTNIAVTENDYLYEWTVPNSPSDSCLIRVSAYPSLDPSDESDSVFSISAAGNRILDPFPNPAWAEKHDYVYFKLTYEATPDGPATDMAVTILTLAGEKVWEGFSEGSSGSAIVTWDFKNAGGEIVAAGPYLAIIKSNGETVVKKFVVLR